MRDATLARVRRYVAAAACVVAALSASAEPAPAPDAAAPAPAPAAEARPPTPPAPPDRLDRGTPRGTLRGFLDAARGGDFALAREFLDLRSLPARMRQRPAELAKQVHVVLDRTLWLDPEALSEDPRGDLDDGLPPSRELVGTIDSAQGDVAVELRRVAREDGTPIWKISATTLRRVPDLYAQFGYSALEERLPPWMLESRWLGVSPWVISALLALAFAAAAASWLLVHGLACVARFAARRTATDVDERLVRLARGPLRLAAGVALFRAGRALITLSAPAQSVLGVLEGVLWVAAFAWLCVRLVDLFTLLVMRRLALHQRGASLAWIPLSQKIAKGVVVVLAAIALLDGLGFDVTAVLASLGIGGIAVALAAQKTLENFLGGVAVLVDKPVAVGDFCRVGEHVGRVEEIGLRSTRLRTLERTVVSIPNGELAAVRIENFDARESIWYHPILGLRYDTPPDRVRRALHEARELLRAHPKLDPASIHVRFFRFGAYSLDLEVFAYVKTRNFDEFLEVAEELNLLLMERIEACGASLALPARRVALDVKPPADSTR